MDTINTCRFTVIETKTFIDWAKEVWSDDERIAFIDWISENPSAGDLIPGSGGIRKVRWSRAGMGKSGGVRVLHTFLAEKSAIALLIVYAKSEYDDLPPELLRKLKEKLNG